MPLDGKIKTVFVHLDLGIGGAEQLVLQLAGASKDKGHQVSIVTSRCDQEHCFDAVNVSLNGDLASAVQVYGEWIPQTLFGLGRALLSTFRMILLSWKVICSHRDADVVVLDVLPSSIPMLRLLLPETVCIIFYCHYPDMLLIQEKTPKTALRGVYRAMLDSLEESTMAMADLVVVNSKFTESQLRKTFTSMRGQVIERLYPILDTSCMEGFIPAQKNASSPIVSLNRYERKKNVELLLRAYAFLKKKKAILPQLTIAGGFDSKNTENIEYLQELGELALKLGVEKDTVFLRDVSDQERMQLFQSALCVVYTPPAEHFGIVPLEAMYCGTPVIAVNSGGPTETVVDGVTGFLRQPTPEDFADAIGTLVEHPDIATRMGVSGRQHVGQEFGKARFVAQWERLVQRGVISSRTTGRRHRKFTSPYVLSAVVALATTTYVLFLALVHKEESLHG